MTVYFEGLNYSLANEDTWIEYHLLPENVDSVFTVCGSGSRVTPLIAKNPKEVHVVDLSETQLKMLRVRLLAAKKLSYPEYLYLLGYKTAAPNSSTRVELMSKLGMEPADAVYWKTYEASWKDQGFIYLGKWESHFMKLGKVFRMIPTVNVAPLFEARNLSEQKEILKKYWKPLVFKYFTKVVMNEAVANRLLYKGHFAGSKGARTMDVTAAEFVFREFNDLFQNTWVRGNYFLNMIFLNKVDHPDNYPAECHESVVDGLKISQSVIHYHTGNLLELLGQRPHDFYSLSDTFSYMKDDDVRGFVAALPPGIKPGSKMVIRTFMRKPAFTIDSPWVSDPGLNKTEAKKDCTRMYEFTILEKK